jgi:hypothetical protein
MPPGRGPRAQDERELRRILGKEVHGALLAFARTGLKDGFYLAGGTGLALHLGHRRPRGLDFFRETGEGGVPWRKVLAELERVP